MGKYILCAESTADDDGLFWLANADVLEMIESIEGYVYDEANTWGGIKQIDGTATLSAARKTDMPVVDTSTVKRLYKICCDADEEFDFSYYEHYYQQLMQGVSFSAKELKYVETVEPSFESQATIIGELNGHSIHVVPVQPVVEKYCAELRYVVQVTRTAATDEFRAHTKRFEIMWHNAIQLTDDRFGSQSIYGLNFTLDEFQDWMRANIDPGIMIQTSKPGPGGPGRDAGHGGDQYYLRHWDEAAKSYKVSRREEIQMPW